MKIIWSSGGLLAIIIVIIVIISIIVVILGSIYRRKDGYYSRGYYSKGSQRSDDCENPFLVRTPHMEIHNYQADDSIEEFEGIEDLEDELQALDLYTRKLKKAIEIKKRRDNKKDCECLMKSFDFNKVALHNEEEMKYVRLFNAESFVMAGVAAVTLYGYTNDNKVTDLSFSKTSCGEGIGIWDDQFNRFYGNDINADRSDEFNYRKEAGWLDNAGDMENTHKVDNKHYVQCDVFQLLPYYKYKCKEPTIVLSCLKGGFEIGGSNVLGEFGVRLVEYVNKDEDNIEVELSLFNPAQVEKPVMFKYISIRAYPLGRTVVGGHFLLKNIDLHICQ
jgi:hypothetical protein